MFSGDYMEYDDVNHILTMYPQGEDKITCRYDPDELAAVLAHGWIAVTGSTPGNLPGDEVAGGSVTIGALPTGSNVIGAVTQSGSWTFTGVQDSRTAGTITSATSVVGPVAVSNRNVVSISISGTYAGVTFIIEATDDGTNFFPVQAINNGTGQAGNTWVPGSNATVSYDVAVGGFTALRVRATAWTSGTANIGITPQSFAYDPVVASVNHGMNGVNTYVIKTDANGNTQVRVTDNTNYMPTMDTAARRGYFQITDGTSSVVAKAASTPAAAADIALVTTLSPNLPVPTMSTISSAATTNATSVKASAGTVYNILVSNTGAAAAYVKFYNKASAPTVGTDVPVFTLSIPASGTVCVNPHLIGIRFATGIALAITNLAADSDTTAVLAAQVKCMTSYI